MRSKKLPNKACTGQAGFVAIYKHFSGSSFFCSQAESTPAPAPVTQTVNPPLQIIEILFKESREKNYANPNYTWGTFDRDFNHRSIVGQMERERAEAVILPKVRDPRFITVRRGGTLQDPDHQLLAEWAADCAEHVLHLFEAVQPADARPRQAIEQARAWVRGEIMMSQARTAAGKANAAARDLSGAARWAAYAAGQAAVVAHVAAHELGAAAYAIKAVRSAAPDGEVERAGRQECQWQRGQLSDAIRDLVLDDQRLRNHICWSVFDC